MAKRPKGEWAEGLPYTNKAFHPYVVALGQFNLAWNDLHVSLSLLFCTLMGGGFVNKFLAIWQNINNDRMQRDVIKAVMLNDEGVMRKGNEDLRKAIEWICKETTSLEDLRNDAIHSPLFAYQRGPSQVLVMPLTGLMHKRAKKLSDKGNLLAELRHCRDVATILRNYTTEIDEAMKKRGIGPWPKIPRLPPRQPSSKNPSSQTHKEKRERPPRSSRA